MVHRLVTIYGPEDATYPKLSTKTICRPQLLRQIAANTDVLPSENINSGIARRLGQIYIGVISGVTSEGHVELNENKCEGLVPAESG